MPPLRIALVGDCKKNSPAQAATTLVMDQAGKALSLPSDNVWVATEKLVGEVSSLIVEYDGIIVMPGSPYQNIAGVLEVIRFARESKRPLLGTCGGMQHIVIEYARNFLGFKDAQHAEYDPYASPLFISPLKCSLVGQTLKVKLKPGSKAASFYAREEAIEQYYCNFGINPEFTHTLENGGLRITGVDKDGEARIVELPDHPFFLGTLFVPAPGSPPENPHPITHAFFRAAEARRVLRSHSKPQ